MKYVMPVMILVVIGLVNAKMQGSCLHKNARKIQKSQLENISDDHVVVEARFYSQNDKDGVTSYRFVTEETFQKNHGDLKPKDVIHIHASGEHSDCFTRLHFSRNYFLILEKPVSDVATSDERSFRAVAPPVPTNIPRVRRNVHKELCTDTRVILPQKKIIYGDQVKMIPCRVQSNIREEEYQIEWVRDGKVVAENGEEVQTEVDEDGRLGLVFVKISIHNAGIYTCRVTVKATSQTFENSTFVEIFDPFYENCDASQCNNHGKCYKHRFSPLQICLCKDGLTGAFCANYGSEAPKTLDVKQDEEEIKTKIRSLTVIVAVLCAVVVMATIVVTYKAHHVKKVVTKFIKTRHSVRKFVKVPVIAASSTTSLPTPVRSNNPYIAVSTSPSRNSYGK